MLCCVQQTSNAERYTAMANSWIGKGARDELYKRDGMICCYCSKRCIKADSRNVDTSLRKDCASLDHIVPQKDLAASATDDHHFGMLRRDPKNLVLVCVGCNSSKQHKSLYVWCKQTQRDYATIIAEIARRIAK